MSLFFIKSCFFLQIMLFCSPLFKRRGMPRLYCYFGQVSVATAFAPLLGRGWGEASTLP